MTDHSALLGALRDAVAAPAALVRRVKATLDPQGLMNPGVLGLR